MEETIHCFQRLGLTQYESAALAALFSRHDATAQEVAEIANIPYTKIYAVLLSLEKQGLLKTTLERPKKYRPLSPEGTLQALLNRKRAEVDYLEERSSSNLDMLNKLYKNGEMNASPVSVCYIRSLPAVWDEVIRVTKL